MFKREKATPSAAEPFDDWCLVAQMPSGKTLSIGGWCYDAGEADEVRGVLAAMRDGLTAAGYEVEVTLTRKQVVPA